MKTLVIGCGLGGLTAAIALRRRGHTVTVIEQAPAPGEVGAGIQVPPNATRLLSELGALDRVKERAIRPVLRIVRDGIDGTEIHRKELGDAVERATGYPYLVLHRADFLDALLDVAGSAEGGGEPVNLEFGHRVNRIDQTADEVVVESDAGGRWAADVLVGADGIRSLTRETIGEPDQPVYSGESMWRATIPSEMLDDELAALAGLDGPSTSVWAGPSRHLVVYPLRNGELVNIAATVPGEEVEESYLTAGRVEDMVSAYEGWDSRLLRLLSQAPSARLWPLFVREPLERWTKGRIALLGDSAHAMLPYQAQGSAQAMEDAVVLASSLPQSGDANAIADALKQYEALRKPRASAIQTAAVRSGETWSASADDARLSRATELQRTEGNAGAVSYDWLWQGSPTQDPHAAMSS